MAGSSQARLREALTGSSPTAKEKGPQPTDGVLTITPDTPEVARVRRSVLDCAPTDSDYLEQKGVPKPADLYGKITWKIDKFSQITKRELRSDTFDAGSYKWYILVYPQGCDVCNHLSLFLCVADFDKLLPGWSHFAQFTIAVVNKDPKKSKYSDTLHRFCKKEHDWGWKKFMELSKVLEGFTVEDTLIIKAQVQVIRDRPSAPFRCLDPQYRRELVRVYLTNVEGICARFMEEKRDELGAMAARADELRRFWAACGAEARAALTMERAEAILKGLVKRFFNEKEVTSTLVMDALFCGCKLLEQASSECLQGKARAPSVMVDAASSSFSLGRDAVDLLQLAVSQAAVPPPRDAKHGEPLGRAGQENDDLSRDSGERDERRLAELGRAAVQTYVIAHIFLEKLAAAHAAQQSLKLQDALIAEEARGEAEAESRLEEPGKKPRVDVRKCSAAVRAAAERVKKARKKEKRKAKALEEATRREEEESKVQQAAAARAADAERKHRDASARASEQAAARAEAEAAEKQRAAEAAAVRQRERKQRQEAAAARQRDDAEAARKQRAAEAQAADRQRGSEAAASRASAPQNGAAQRHEPADTQQGFEEQQPGVAAIDQCMPAKEHEAAQSMAAGSGAGPHPASPNGLHRTASTEGHPAVSSAASLTRQQRQAAIAAQAAALEAHHRQTPHMQQQAATPQRNGSMANGAGSAAHRQTWNLDNGHTGVANGAHRPSSTSSHAAIANGGHPAGYRGAAPHGSAAMSPPQQLSSGGDGEMDADEAVSSSGTAPAGQSHTSSASEDELASPTAALPWIQKHVRLPDGAGHANGHFIGAGHGRGPAAAADLASVPSLSSSPSAAAALDAAGSTYSSISGSSRPSSRDGSLDLSLDASNGSVYGGHPNGGHHHANGGGAHAAAPSHGNGGLLGGHAGPRAQQHGHGHPGGAAFGARAPAPGPGPGYAAQHVRGPSPPTAAGAHQDGRTNGFAGQQAKPRPSAGPPTTNGNHHPMGNAAPASRGGQHALGGSSGARGGQQAAASAHAHSSGDRPVHYSTAGMPDRAGSLPVPPPPGHAGGGGARFANWHAAVARVPLLDAVTVRHAVNGGGYRIAAAGQPAGASPPQRLPMQPAYSTPLPMKRLEVEPQESPNLDGFAHMSIISDLLD